MISLRDSLPWRVVVLTVFRWRANIKSLLMMALPIYLP